METLDSKWESTRSQGKSGVNPRSMRGQSPKAGACDQEKLQEQIVQK